ncbi:hypothetical protein [Streptomyces sp. CAU 1734]|uniref:hypothetical protein n=1 Tax=Streptomyces sp. CAU 1734 TaxID=3140360 RepID=UPI003260F122
MNTVVARDSDAAHVKGVYVRGDGVKLTAEVTALGHTAQPGEAGVVEEVHAGGLMTIRLESGRRTFPQPSEVVRAG